jgi:DNA-binding response OmpR family regulator
MTSETANQAQRETIPVVLVVEDDDALREFLCVALGDEFTVFSTVSGLDAVRLTRELHPSVVVLDVMLPGLSGLEVVEQIRADPDLQDTPVLVMTAFSDIDPADAISAGANRFLAKPFEVGELVDAIRSLL